MRDAARITRTPKEYAEFQRAERQRYLRELLGILRRARDRGEEWYRWIENGRPPYTTEQYRALEGSRRGGRT